MSSHVRQHKSPYFYVPKGGGFVLLENHVETGTRYKTEAEAKRAVLALNDAWRAKGAKSNPRNPRPPMRRNFFSIFKSAPPLYRVTAYNRDGSTDVHTATSHPDLEFALEDAGIKERDIPGLMALASRMPLVDSGGDVFKRMKEAYGWERVTIELVGERPQAKSNPRRRNPGAAGEAEMVLWARPAGKTNALYEEPIYTQGRTMEDIERVKKLAAKDGWHTFRVQRIDLSEPYNPQKEFAATIRGSRRRNPLKFKEGRDPSGMYKLSDLKKGEFFKRKPTARKVYTKGDYDRGSKKYGCGDYEAAGDEIFLTGDTMVYVGFDY